MADSDDQYPAVKLTKRGAATRAAIVRAAAELMYVNGVAATDLVEVQVASATSKSQFYRHFSDKDDLVYAVIAMRTDEVLALENEALEAVDTIRGLQQWIDRFVRRSALRRGAWGSELGSLAAELADVDEYARARLAEHFKEWERLLAGAFDRMRDRGVLREDVDAMRLAIGVVATIEGGHLLAQTAHDSFPMVVAAGMAVDYVRSFAVTPPTS